MKVRFSFAVRAVVCAGLVSACGGEITTPSPTAGPSFAKGGGGGGGGGTTGPARCATVTVTNNAQSVRRSVMPDIKYNLENCGTSALSITVTIAETAGFLSVLCPSPVAAPAHFALAVGKKVSATAPVFRGTCGMTSNVNGVLVQGINAWQGHNLLLTVTDDAGGATLSSGAFSWQDILNPGL